MHPQGLVIQPRPEAAEIVQRQSVEMMTRQIDNQGAVFQYQGVLIYEVTSTESFYMSLIRNNVFASLASPMHLLKKSRSGYLNVSL